MLFDWLLSLVVAFLLGYQSRRLVNRVTTLEQTLVKKTGKPPEPEAPKSEIIDPLDPVQTAMYEHKKMMEKLNGQ